VPCILSKRRQRSKKQNLLSLLAVQLEHISCTNRVSQSFAVQIQVDSFPREIAHSKVSASWEVLQPITDVEMSQRRLNLLLTLFSSSQAWFPHQHAKNFFPQMSKIGFHKLLAGTLQYTLPKSGKLPPYLIHTKLMQISRRLLDRPHTKSQLLEESALNGRFTYNRITP